MNLPSFGYSWKSRFENLTPRPFCAYINNEIANCEPSERMDNARIGKMRWLGGTVFLLPLSA